VAVLAQSLSAGLLGFWLWRGALLTMAIGIGRGWRMTRYFQELRECSAFVALKSKDYETKKPPPIVKSGAV
jgi:hypothetical protein